MIITDVLDIDEVPPDPRYWDTTLKAAFNRLARSGNYTLDINLVSNTGTVSDDDFNDNAHFSVTGASDDAELILPQKRRRFLVTNRTSFTLNVHMPTGDAVDVAPHSIADIISDLTNLALVIANGTSERMPFGGLPSETQTAPMSFPFGGQPADGRAFHIPLTQAYTVPADFEGSAGYASTVATADAVFEVGYVRNGSYTAIGTLTFALGDSILTLSTQDPVNLLSIDILRVTTPTPMDATLADCGITVVLLKV